jgi:hypothetical protein
MSALPPLSDEKRTSNAQNEPFRYRPEADIRPPDKLVGARPQTQLKTNLSTEDLKGDEIGID